MAGTLHGALSTEPKFGGIPMNVLGLDRYFDVHVDHIKILVILSYKRFVMHYMYI